MYANTHATYLLLAQISAKTGPWERAGLDSFLLAYHLLFFKKKGKKKRKKAGKQINRWVHTHIRTKTHIGRRACFFSPSLLCSNHVVVSSIGQSSACLSLPSSRRRYHQQQPMQVARISLSLSLSLSIYIYISVTPCWWCFNIDARIPSTNLSMLK